MSAAHVIVVLVTTSGEEESQRLARALLERKLIACANIVPRVRSLFRWEGAIEDAGESLLILKSTTDALKAVEECVHQHHSYDVPEVIALPVSGGSEQYLAWVTAEVAPAHVGNQPD